MSDLATPAGTAQLLRAHGIRPRKRFGQHFLVSRATLRRILDAAALTPHDGVLEIGAGIGTLTAALAPLVDTVVAVELDRALLPALRETIAPFPNVRVETGDVMRFDLAALVAPLPSPRKAVSNLPYNIASPLIVNLLEAPVHFTRLVFTVQREVAQRLAAPPGGKDYGALSVAVQYRAEARVVARVPSGAFFPPPDVESAVVVLEPRAVPPVDVGDEGLFFRVVRAAFAQRRKTLRNTLAAGLAVSPAAVEAACRAAGVDPGRRGETLDLTAFAALTRALRMVRR
ncbi:MAG TPA: 16S rRNA (adenine(1518)-N(6)/adenine(1519)-N(6))-dimethyltransferase RsmA [bacterium]|nr:16S rRNA (adenine(1518)-N(6)/adenine(1519)-N(6))-dimethyltransferase RsmA [bacterium]